MSAHHDMGRCRCGVCTAPGDRDATATIWDDEDREITVTGSAWWNGYGPPGASLDDAVRDGESVTLTPEQLDRALQALVDAAFEVEP